MYTCSFNTRKVNIPSFVNNSLVYNGLEQSFKIRYSKYINIDPNGLTISYLDENEDNEYDYILIKAINVGTYNITASLTTTNNMCWNNDTTSNITLSCTITPKSSLISWNYQDSYTYSGNVISKPEAYYLDVNNNPINIDSQYIVIIEGDSEFKNAGNYKFKVSDSFIANINNYSFDANSLTSKSVTISKKVISFNTSYEFNYDGLEKEINFNENAIYLNVVNQFIGDAISAGNDYSVKVTIKNLYANNYCLENNAEYIICNFVIKKADLTITFKLTESYISYFILWDQLDMYLHYQPNKMKPQSFHM